MHTPPSKCVVLPPRFPLDGVDAANLGDCMMFMHTDDKLYRGCVSESHRRAVSTSDDPSSRLHLQPSAVTNQTIMTVTDARYGNYVILNHIIAHGLNPVCLDTTSGNSVSCIRYGNFFRTIGYHGKAYCFDSMGSADLMPFNIHLNGLETHVECAPAATSLMTFLNAEATKSAFINLSSAASLKEIESSFATTPSVVTFEIHAGNKESLEVLSSLLETHILFDVGFAHRPFCFTPVTPRDVKQFIRIVANYPHRATHVMGIARHIPEVNELAYQLACLTPGPVEYSLVIEHHVPSAERTKPRLAEQVEVFVVPTRAERLAPTESPFLGDMPVIPASHDIGALPGFTVS